MVTNIALQKAQDSEQLASLLRNLINNFPSAVPDLNSDSQRPDPRVQQIVRETLRQWNLGLPSHRYEKAFIAGYSIAITAYHHVPSPQLQADIALFTGLAILVDDAAMGLPAIEEFVQRFVSGSQQLHPSLDRFVESVHTLAGYFPPFAANIVLSSTIDYVNSELFQRQEKENTYLHRGSIPYTKYMRSKDGYGEAYAACVWPKSVFPDAKKYVQAIPYVVLLDCDSMGITDDSIRDTMEYLTLINDIFSYYKEIKAGETGTFVLNFATANQQTGLDALQDLITYLLALVERGYPGRRRRKSRMGSFCRGLYPLSLTGGEIQISRTLTRPALVKGSNVGSSRNSKIKQHSSMSI